MRQHIRGRLRALRRDNYQCQLAYEGICQGRANELDHVVALCEGGLLRGQCDPTGTAG